MINQEYFVEFCSEIAAKHDRLLLFFGCTLYILRSLGSGELATMKANCVDNETRHVVNESLCDVIKKPEVDAKYCIADHCPVT